MKQIDGYILLSVAKFHLNRHNNYEGLQYRLR